MTTTKFREEIHKIYCAMHDMSVRRINVKNYSSENMSGFCLFIKLSHFGISHRLSIAVTWSDAYPHMR